MKYIRYFVGAIDSLNIWCEKIFRWIPLILVLLVVFEVVARRFFDSPTVWNLESTTQLYACYFMMTLGFTLLKNQHISLDICSNRFSERTRAVVAVITSLVFFFPFCAIVVWQGALFAQSSWQILERSRTAFSPPVYPIKTVLPVAGLLLLLQGLSIFIKNLYFAIKGNEL